MSLFGKTNVCSFAADDHRGSLVPRAWRDRAGRTLTTSSTGWSATPPRSSSMGSSPVAR